VNVCSTRIWKKDLLSTGIVVTVRGDTEPRPRAIEKPVAIFVVPVCDGVDFKNKLAPDINSYWLKSDPAAEMTYQFQKILF